jgi:hypothetical protein
MRILIPEKSFLWTPKGLVLPKNLTDGSELFVINLNNKLEPIYITNEPEVETMKVTTVITNVSTFTVPQEFNLIYDNEKISVTDLKIGDQINHVENDKIKTFQKYFVENSEQLENCTLNVMKARALAKTLFEPSKEFPFLVPKDREDIEEARKIKDDLYEDFDDDDVVLRFTREHEKYKYGGKSNPYPCKIFIKEKNFVRIRSGIDHSMDKIPADIYSSGLNALLHFHKIALDDGVPKFFDYEVRNKQNPYLILKLPWDSIFRKLFQNTCLFEKKIQLRLYESREQRSNNEVKLETASSNGVLTHQKVLDIKHQKLQCYEIEIPMGSKLVIDNYMFEPVSIDVENRNVPEIEEINFEKIRNSIESKITDESQPRPITIKTVNSIKPYMKFGVIGKIIDTTSPQERKTRFSTNLTFFKGVIEDDTFEIKFRVWTSKELPSDMDYKGKLLFIPFGFIKNGIIGNTKNSEIYIYDEMLNELY